MVPESNVAHQIIIKCRRSELCMCCSSASEMCEIAGELKAVQASPSTVFWDGLRVTTLALVPVCREQGRR